MRPALFYDPSFVLDNPDVFLVELRLQPFLFGLPEALLAARVTNLIDPVFFGIELACWAEPRALRLAFPRPPAVGTDHPRMERVVPLPSKDTPKVVTLRKQNSRDERHR